VPDVANSSRKESSKKRKEDPRERNGREADHSGGNDIRRDTGNDVAKDARKSSRTAGSDVSRQVRDGASKEPGSDVTAKETRSSTAKPAKRYAGKEPTSEDTKDRRRDDPVSEQVSQRGSEKTSGKVSDSISEKVVDSVSEKAPERVTDIMSDRHAGKKSGKPASKAALGDKPRPNSAREERDGAGESQERGEGEDRGRRIAQRAASLLRRKNRLRDNNTVESAAADAEEPPLRRKPQREEEEEAVNQAVLPQDEGKRRGERGRERPRERRQQDDVADKPGDRGDRRVRRDASRSPYTALADKREARRNPRRSRDRERSDDRGRGGRRIDDRHGARQSGRERPRASRERHDPNRRRREERRVSRSIPARHVSLSRSPSATQAGAADLAKQLETAKIRHSKIAAREAAGQFDKPPPGQEGSSVQVNQPPGPAITTPTVPTATVGPQVGPAPQLPASLRGLLDRSAGGSIAADALQLKQKVEERNAIEKAKLAAEKEEKKEETLRLAKVLHESLLDEDNKPRLLALTGLVGVSLDEQEDVVVRANSQRELQLAIGKLRRLAYHCQWGCSKEKVGELLLGKPAKPINSMVVRLAAVSSRLPSHEARLTATAPKLRIGTEKGVCDLAVTSVSGLSRKHCTITFEPDKGAAYIQDLSTNGTFLNGRRLPKPPYKSVQDARVRVVHGDEVSIRRKSEEVEELGWMVNIVKMG